VRLTRSFLESLVAAAAAAALFLFGIFDTLIGPLGAFFSPAPLIWTTYRNGPASAMAALALSTAMLLPVPPPTAFLSYLTGSLFPAFLLGIFFRRGTGIARSSALAAVAAVLFSLAGSALYFAAAGLDPLPFLKYQVGDMVREAEYAVEALSGDAGISATRLPEFFARTLPSVVLVTVFIQCGINLLIVCRILSRTLAARGATPDMTRFSVPEQTVWVLIPVLALQWAPSAPIRTAALNAAILLLFFYLLHGLSIAAHFLRRMNATRPVRMILIIALLLQPYLLAVPLCAGIVDFRFDLRTRWPLSPGQP
jgi:uncharacterized protein YybS (DUF2232 family)